MHDTIGKYFALLAIFCYSVNNRAIVKLPSPAETEPVVVAEVVGAEGPPSSSTGGGEGGVEGEDELDEPTTDDFLASLSDEELVGKKTGGNITADGVRIYLRQIGRAPLLTAEDEVSLAKAIEAGLYAEHLLDAPSVAAGAGHVAVEAELDGTEPSPPVPVRPSTRAMQSDEYRMWLEVVAEEGRKAKTGLLEGNLRLVVSVAKRYVGRGLAFLDLIQDGNLGLIRAVEKFDYTKGYKFSTYAMWWIRQSITRGLADDARTIRVPVHMVETINKLARVQRQLTGDLGRDPTPEELAVEMGLEPSKIIEIQSYGRDPVSLDKRLDPDDPDGTEFGTLIEDTEAIAPPDEVAFSLLGEAIRGVLDTLSEREAGIIRLHFGLDDGRPRTLEEIGKVYGVTRERIRQIETKTMAKLRHPSRADVLRDYLD